MSSGHGTVLSVAGFLIEGNYSIYIAVDSITSVHSVERLGVVSAQTEVMNILCKTVDVVILA